jgi:uncharacterized protein
VEEARANDPKELKATIAKLEGEIAKLKSAAPAAPDKDALKAAEEKGFEQAKKKLTRESERAALDAIASAMEAIDNQFSAAIVALKERLKVTKAQRVKLDVELEPTPAPLAPRPASSVPLQTAPRVQPVAPNGKGQLERPVQTIIDAIRWWNVMGVAAPTHGQTAFIAGYSHKSGTWATYLSRLRSMGLIEGRGDLVLTAEGAATANEPSAPPSGEHLRATVLAKIEGPLQRILSPVIAVYPNGLSHDEAGEKAGYSSKSGTWATYLSRLRSLDLIDGRGELRAQDWLFHDQRFQKALLADHRHVGVSS